MVDVVCVNVPSLAWIAKLNVPVVAFPSVTTNPAPPAFGVSVAGLIEQVVGAPAMQLNCTFPEYPLIAVNVPAQLTLWPMTVVFGVPETAIEKSAAGPDTVRLNACVFAAGAPKAVAAIVTDVAPDGVAAPAVTVNVIVTGDDAVGLTTFDGEKLHAAPAGNPEEQLSVAVSVKLPAAVT